MEEKNEKSYVVSLGDELFDSEIKYWPEPVMGNII